MKTQLASIALLALTLCACSESQKDYEVEQGIAQIKKAQKSLEDYRQHLGELIKRNEELGDFLHGNGEQITQQWNESLEACTGKNTEPCNELREAFRNFKKAVADNVKETQDVAEAFLESRDN